MTLKFGTDGWRAVIADEFTFANVRRVCAGVSRAFAPAGAQPGIAVVGHDTRFLSSSFASAAAETLLAAGHRVLLTRGPAPTPAVSCAVVDAGASFGVVITASHNAAQFSGVKIKEAVGSSAWSETTSAIEAGIPDTVPPGMPLDEGERRGALSRVSFAGAHTAQIGRVVDLPALRASGLRVVADPMHGACGRLLESLLEGGTARVTTINAHPDPLFGGHHPEPLEMNLATLKHAVLERGAEAGFATDGDGDRIGAFDERGVFVSPLRIAPLIARSLLKKGRRGPLGKTFANTILLDRVARHFGQPFHVFPVGFKHLARELAAGRMLLGGEESGGIGIAGYIPERDGVLISLLIMQAMHEEQKPLSELVADMVGAFGDLCYRRVDLPCAPERGLRLVASLARRLPEDVGGMRVTGYDDLDGLKLLFGEDGWLLFRASGTEPVLRIYAEVPAQERLDAVIAHALRLVDDRLDTSVSDPV